MGSMIQFYNQELERLKDKKLNNKDINKFINLNSKKIQWSSSLKSNFIKGNGGKFRNKCIRKSSYRPFMKSYIYFDSMFNERQRKYLFSRFTDESIENKVICVSGLGAKSFSTLITNNIPDLNYMKAGSQCFPLYWFDKSGSLQEGVTDNTLNKFRSHYKDNSSKKIEKEDIFYYIYGLLHSEVYREKYKSNLDKSLPHIPLVSGFWQFSSIGRQLAEFHLNYENQQPPKEVKILKQGKAVNISELAPEELQVKKNEN